MTYLYMYNDDFRPCLLEMDLHLHVHVHVCVYLYISNHDFVDDSTIGANLLSMISQPTRIGSFLETCSHICTTPALKN